MIQRFLLLDILVPQIMQLEKWFDDFRAYINLFISDGIDSLQIQQFGIICKQQ